jgi:hypothetical protein
MPFGEESVYYEDHKKPINTVWRQHTELLNDKWVIHKLKRFSNELIITVTINKSMIHSSVSLSLHVRMSLPMFRQLSHFVRKLNVLVDQGDNQRALSPIHGGSDSQLPAVTLGCCNTLEEARQHTTTPTGQSRSPLQPLEQELAVSRMLQNYSRSQGTKALHSATR